MDQLASILLIFGTVAIAASSLWLVLIAVRTRWWWLPLFFLVVPMFVFMVKERRKLKGPGVVFLIAVLFSFGGLIVAGDLVRNQHPDEPMTRTFMQKAFGCSGAELWASLLADDRELLTRWLAQHRIDTTNLSGDLAVARQAVHVAALTYLPEEEIEATVLAMAPTARATTVATKDYQAVVIVTEQAAFIGFRGTDNARNWVNNFKFLPAQTPWGTVHAGFRDGFDALWPAILPALDVAEARNRPIWLTGHSLGGTFAVLGASELLEAGRQVAGVVTFGQPPVGFNNFAEQWNAKMAGRLIRYVNHRDAVAAIAGPIAVPWLSLIHAGEERYFDTTGTLHVTRPSMLQMSRDAVCASSFEDAAEFGAHGMRRYLALVSLAAEKLPAR